MAEEAYEKLSLADFVSQLASARPVPGGGGASALVGSVGTALGHMVGSLTLGKKKYADVQEDIAALNERARLVQEKLMALIDRDAEVFEPLSRAYGLPSATEAEREAKERIMEEALISASAVPIEIMKACCEGIELLDEYAAKGTAIAISDVGVGAVFLRSALLGASLNVFINTKGMKDRAAADRLNKEADRMIEKYGTSAEHTYSAVAAKFRG